MTRRISRWLATGALLAFAVFAAHEILARRSALWINRRLAKLSEKTSGAEASVREARVTIFPGKMQMEDLRVMGRPASTDAEPLFSAGRIAFDLSWAATLRGRRPVLRSADFEDLHLRLERHADESWNIAAVMPPAAPPTDEIPAVAREPDAPVRSVHHPAEKPAPAGEPLPPFSVDRLRAALDVTLENITQSAFPRPFSLLYKLDLEIDNFRTFVRDEFEPWAEIRLNGHIHGDPGRGCLELAGRLAPVALPDRLSFDIEGILSGLDTDLLRKISGWDITVDDAAIDVRLSAREGVFDETASLLVVRVKNLQLGSAWGAYLKGATVSRASIPVPLRGTVSHPDVAWGRAMADTLRMGSMETIGRGLKKMAESLKDK